MTLQPDLAQAFDRLLVKARSATLTQFDQRGLAWLCLVPDWAVPLATACGFPAGPAGIDAFVDGTAAVGLSKTWETIGPDGEPVRWFGATDDRRAELLEHLRSEWKWQQRDLLAEARKIADQLRAATAGTPAQPQAPALARWAELVRAETARGSKANSANAVLWDTVREHVDGDDTGPALDWIYAGEALGPLLGAPMTAAVARCRRYLERRYRRRIDERYLRHLLPRHEQEAEVARLLDGPDSDWALHLIGMGGVGKTMLIRSLTAGPFGRQRQIPMARVDFDHIEPDYPLSRPGQLLVELSVELSALFTNEDQEARYERFLDDTERLHEISGGPATDPLAVLRTRQARSAFASFARLLRTLPKPVLLVLDTCEELAKLHPAGTRIPAVDATFEILQRIHAEEPSFRVLFAGRRLLAPSGHDWRADDAARPPYLDNLDERPYLRLFEARGFDAGEVGRYLREHRQLTPSPELLDAVLGFSAELGRVPGVPAAADDDRPRYNPYDIDLLADWLKAEPDIDPLALTAAGLDAYVAARIFGRLDAGLQQAAAAAALLRCFDERLLSLAGVPARDAAGRSTLAKLLEQEWIDLEREDSSGSRFLQVRPALWPRLQRFAGSAEFEPQVAPVRSRLLRELRVHLEITPLRTLSFEAVEAYLRLAGQADACAAWDAIERRVADAPAEIAESAWSWARSVTERLVGEAGGLTITPLLAAVSATLAAAVARTDPAADLRPQWAAVLAGSAGHPDPVTAARLQQRARLGLLTAGARLGSPDQAAGLSHLRHALRSGSDLAGGILASVEALLESHGPLGIRAEEFASWLDTAGLGLPDSLAVAWGRALHARIAAREGNVQAALGLFEAAQAAARDGVPVPSAELLDWSPPASVLQRIRAERLWLEWVTLNAGTQRIAQEVADAIASPSDDGWCLVALAAAVLVDSGRISEALDCVAGVSPLAGWSLRCALHRGVPPMAEVQARALLAAGQGLRAQVTVRTAIAQLSKDRASDERVTRLRIAELELVRALRDPSASSVTGQAIYSDNPGLGAAGWLAAALTEPPGRISLGGFAASYLSDDVLLHARFRSSTAAVLRENEDLVQAIAARAVAVSETAAAPGTLPVVAIDLGLDALELARLGLAGGKLPDPAALADILNAHIGALAGNVQPGSEFERERLMLRLSILSGNTPVGPLELPILRMARQCLEEGELLALRLPALGKRHLKDAYTCFQGSGDHGGEMAAAVTSALASVHADDRKDLPHDLARAQRAWDGLRSVVTGLPAWTGPGARPAEPDRTPQARAWDGWTLRVEALLDQATPKPIGGPAELDLRPWDGAQRRAQDPGWPSPPVSSLLTRPWLLIAGGVIGAAAATFVIFFVSALVRLAAHALNPAFRLGFWTSFWISWALFLFVIAIGLYGPQASRRITRPLVAIFKEDVTCTPVAGEVALVSFDMRLRPAMLNALPPLLLNALGAFVAFGAAFSFWYLAPYGVFTQRAVRGAPIDVQIPLAPRHPSRYRARQLVQRADWALRTTAALRAEAYVDQPWELLLAVTRTRAGDRRRCFRVVSVTAVSPLSRWPVADHALVVSPQWMPFADYVWTRPRRVLARRAATPPPEETGQARVVHVIGTPLLTSTGWCLRVAGSRSSQVSESFETSKYSPGPSYQAQAAVPALLSPDDPALSAGAIVVVQVDPSGSSIASDPDQAAGLRQFGHQVVVATGRPVIVVPSLPASVARRLMRSLARSVRGRSRMPSLDRTLDWVDRLRRVILGHPLLADGSWDKLAAAYDIVLFWPEADRRDAYGG